MLEGLSFAPNKPVIEISGMTTNIVFIFFLLILPTKLNNFFSRFDG